AFCCLPAFLILAFSIRSPPLMRPHFLLPFALGAVSLAGAGLLHSDEAAKPADPAKPVSYWKDIRPLLQTSCQGCHQPAKAKGGYIMTDFAALVKGGEDDGAAV